jgi:TolB-like protein
MNHRLGLLIATIAITAGLCGCAMPGSRYQGRAPLQYAVDRTQAAETIIGVMQEHGYTPSVVNERVGTITSDWRSNDHWLAVMFGQRNRDRITITVSDSLLTMTGEYQERSSEAFDIFGGDGNSHDSGWYGTTAPEQCRTEWDAIRDEVLLRAQALPSVAGNDTYNTPDAPSRSKLTSRQGAAPVAVPIVEPLARENRTRVAVVDFNGIGLSPDEVMILTDRLRAELVDTGRFTVVEREQMNEILSEQGFQQSGLCSTDDCVVEMGRLVGVGSIIAGTFGKLGDTYTVTARLIDVESGEITARASEDCACAVDELLRSMHRVSVLLASRTE